MTKMIQNIISDQVNDKQNKELQKKNKSVKKDVKKVKNVKMVDGNGKVVYRPIHRNEFERRTSIRISGRHKDSYNRLYIRDRKYFKQLLKEFNSATEQFSLQDLIKQDKYQSILQPGVRHHFIPSGLANVKLKFCTRCEDESKHVLMSQLFCFNVRT